MYNKPTGGLFGGTANTSFGSTSFGATSSPFGANQGASFGGTAFGNTQTSSGGMFGASGGTGLFGGTPAQGGSLFGGTSAFGTNNATSNTFGFGSGVAATTQQSMGLFGNTSSNTFGSTSLFGQQPQQQSTFGQSGGSLFGGMMSGGGFLGGAQTTGTTVKFVPVVSSEQMVKGGVTTNINTKLQCITAMKEYEAKSLEELRLEDYGANRKSGALVTGAFGGSNTAFMQGSQPQQTGFSMFANQNKTGFTGFGGTSTAAGSTSLFGGFGAQSKPLFGSSSLASTTAPTNTFGGLNTASSFFPSNSNKFGAASTQPSLGFSFGSTQQSSSPFALSTSQNNTTGGFFGKKPALGFGQPAASSAASVPTFGLKPATQTPFATPAFGTSLFNKAPATSASPFAFGASGSTSLAFGGFAGQQSTSLQAPSFGSLGTQPAASNTLFGANKGSLFGTSNPPAFNLGGSFLNTSATANTGLASAPPAAPNDAWVQQIGDHIKALNKSPYGDSPLLKNLILDPQRKEELTRPTNPAAQKSLLVSHLKTTSLKTTPKSFSPSTKVSLFNDLEEEDVNIKATSSSTKKNYKELKPQALAFDHKLSTDFTHGLDYASDEYFSPDKFHAKTSAKSYFSTSLDGVDHGSNADNTMAEFNVIKDLNKSDNNSKDTTSKRISFSRSGVVLSRKGYYTVPSMKKIDGMVDENGECWVDGLVVGREGYGSVTFPGITNVAGLNLDNIVFFSTKELEIYPEESSKPPVGHGLNKRAQVTLEKAFPIDKSTGKPISDYSRLRQMGYIRKLQKKSVKMGAQFVDFNKQGDFIFLVEHFSKYSLNDDSDDSDADQTTPNKLSHPIKTLQVRLSTATTTLPADHLTAAAKLFSSTLDQQLKVQQKQNYSPIYPNIISLAGDSSSEDEEARGPNEEITHNEQEVPMVGGEDNDDDDDLAGDADVVRAYRDDEEEEEEEESKHVEQDNQAVDSKRYTGLGGYVDEEEEEEVGVMEGVQCDVDMHRRGVTSKNLQMHKAYFFDDEEEEDGGDGGGGGLETEVGVEEGVPMVTHGSLKDDVMRPSYVRGQCMHPETKVVPPLSQHTLESIPISAPLPNLPIPHHLLSTPIPLEQSVMYARVHAISDASLYHANCLRACFFNHHSHPGWHFTNLSEALLCERARRGDVDPHESSSLVHLKCLPLHISPKDEQSRLVCILQVELEHCDVIRHETPVHTCPHVDFSADAQALMSHMIGRLKSLSDQSEWTEKMMSVWNLCWALWGAMREGVGAEGAGHMGGVNEDYFKSRVRKMRLSQWLSRSSRKVIEQEIERHKEEEEEEDDGYITFTFMTGGMLTSAIQSALSVKDHRMALLLSQATMNTDDKLVLRKQVDQWIDSKADLFISDHRLMLTSMLSGMLQVRCNNKQLNCCQHLDWKRAFALHLWYTTPSNHPVEVALQHYQDSFMNVEAHTPKPWPSHMRHHSEKEEVYDVEFNLLRLFAEHHYPLHLLLNPLSFSHQLLDYSCSWHLLKLLGSLNYRHLSDQHHAYICHSYASQLEVTGLWWWAVFVLMHINNPVTREDAVKKILMRNVTSNNRLTDDDDEEEDDGDASDDGRMRDLRVDATGLLNERDLFVVEKLMIPRSWLHQAKAIKAEYRGQTYTQLRHLFMAGLHQQYSSILQQNLLSDMVVKGMYMGMRYWLSPLLDSSGLNTCLSKLYLQFVDLVGVLEECSTEQGEGKLQELLNDISSSIHLLPTHSPTNKLAARIVGKTVSKGVHFLLSSQRPHSDDLYAFLADIETRLPLPLNSNDSCHFDKSVL